MNTSIAQAALPQRVSPTIDVRGVERLLFALTAKERLLFFPDDGIHFTNTVKCEWFDRKQQDSPDAWLRLLQSFRPTVLVTCWDTPSIPETFLNTKDCPLRYVCHLTGSTRQIVPRSFLARGGVLTNWGGLASTSVAEQALLLALSALRNQSHWQSYIRREHTNSYWPVVDLETRSLFDRRVGLHGFGHIARTLIQLLRPFHVSLFAYSEGVPPDMMQTLGVTPCNSLSELFSSSDILFECEALTPKSAGSVNATVLSALPDDAVFVNIGRGQVVNESALLREVRRGRIRVALDVVAQEPVSSKSEVMNIPGVVISPHIGGPTPDRFPVCGRFAIQNLRRYFNNEPLEAVITPEIFDRST